MALTYWKLERFTSYKMTAIKRVVVKQEDGQIPVFLSYHAASRYVRTHYAKGARVYPEKLLRLSKRHVLIPEERP